MRNYPTAWQRRVLWTVYTYLAIVAGAAVAIAIITLVGRSVAFFQPVLLPFALAAVLAYLLEPLVRMITARTRLSRMWAVLVVFLFIFLALGTLGVAVVPRIYNSTSKMVQDAPEFAHKAQERLLSLLDSTQKRLDKLNGLLPGAKSSPAPSPGAGQSPAPDATAASPDAQSPAPAASAPPADSQSPAPTPGASPGPSASPGAGNDGVPPKDGPAPSKVLQPNGIRAYIQQQMPALEGKVPAVLDSVWKLLISSIGGVLGAAGALLDAIIIPVYLYFLLVESRNIARHWNEYLPIRDSPFKKEVVSVLLEINGYIVAFFRGQLIVSTIDAILIGGSLAIMGLDFSFFIGLLVVVLTFIPYLGIILCYIPAILIAIMQYGDFWHPLYVVAIMFTVQTLESTIISPKIVGDSVGLASGDGDPFGVRLVAAAQRPHRRGAGRAAVRDGQGAAAPLHLGTERTRTPFRAGGRGVERRGWRMRTGSADEATHGKTDADGPRRAGPRRWRNTLPVPAPTRLPHPPAGPGSLT